LDLAITEISHEQVIREIPEAGGRNRESPGSVEGSRQNQPLEQIADGIKKSTLPSPAPGTARYREGLRGILLGVGHIKLAAKILDVDRRLGSWKTLGLRTTALKLPSNTSMVPPLSPFIPANSWLGRSHRGMLNVSLSGFHFFFSFELPYLKASKKANLATDLTVTNQSEKIT